MTDLSDFNFVADKFLNWEPVTKRSYASFGTIKRKKFQSEEVTVTEVTEEWLEEGATPPPDWDNKHWMTCTHRSEHSMVMLREAEQVAVFEDREHQRVHVSVRVEGWFMCKIIPSRQWYTMEEPDVIPFVNEQMASLKQMMQPPGGSENNS